jgi:hypothetical protein
LSSSNAAERALRSFDYLHRNALGQLAIGIGVSGRGRRLHAELAQEPFRNDERAPLQERRLREERAFGLKLGHAGLQALAEPVGPLLRHVCRELRLLAGTLFDPEILGAGVPETDLLHEPRLDLGLYLREEGQPKPLHPLDVGGNHVLNRECRHERLPKLP